VVIAVIGSLLVMAGLMLGFATQVVPSGLPGAGVAAGGLVAGGMFCGLVLIAASDPSPRAGGRRRRGAGPE
jgi:hypothetical protein